MKHIEKAVIALSVILFFPGFTTSSCGQGIVLNQSNENGIYRSGETARITLVSYSLESDSVSVTIIRDFTERQTRRIVNPGTDTLEIFSEILSGPVTYIFEASTKTGSASIGLIVGPEEFKPGTSRPKDLGRFWRSEKKELRALPLLIKEVPVHQSDTAYQCFDTEINCTGPKPARGYFARPSSAAKKSLPIIIYFHAAGVYGEWCRSKPEIALRYAKMGNGSLAFDLNAHGMLNGQPDSYYRDLEDNELKNYAQTGLENRETVYFRGMYLRLIRTLDYLTSMPEWDGKRILVIGESQGGGQALAAAGLDKRVSAVIATVPAMCDWGGSLVGRKGCWPYPFETKNDRAKMLSALPYFDAAHLLKGSKATIVAEIGLIDMTCPSSAIYAALNQARGKKIIFAVPYRAHHMTQPQYKTTWETSVLNKIDAFLNDYLK